MYRLPAKAIEINGITFNVDVSASSLSLAGSVTGDFLGAGLMTIPITEQAAGSLTAALDGTLTATVDVSGAVPQTIGFDGGNLVPQNSGSWSPGNFTPDPDPNDPNTSETFAGPDAAQYGFRVDTLVDAALRGTALTGYSSAPETVTAGSFPGTNMGLEFLSQGFLDIFGPAIDAFVHTDPTDLIVQFEIDPNAINPDPNVPGPYPGNLVWREITSLLDPNTPQAQPVYGSLALAFSDGALDLTAPDPADAVVLFDPNNPGTALSQRFPHSGAAASLIVSAVGGPGGDDIDLDLVFPWASTGAFFIGDYLVELTMTGTIEAVALGVDTLPITAGDINDDGSVDGLDVNIVSANFLTSVPPFTNGDVNGDGVVNGLDATVISANFLTSSPATASSSSFNGADVVYVDSSSLATSTAVPEPSGLVLVWLFLSVAGLPRRRPRGGRI